MPARKKLNHDDRTREKIRTSQLINRLIDHIHGKIELSTSQVRAIEILMKKTLPDLAATHSTTDHGKTFEEWLEDLNEESETPDN